MDLTRLRGEYDQKGFVVVVFVLSTWTRERDSMMIILITTTVTTGVVIITIINIVINRGTPRIVTSASDFVTHILPEYCDSFHF